MNQNFLDIMLYADKARMEKIEKGINEFLKEFGVNQMNDNSTTVYKLDSDKIQSLEDVKKILNGLDLAISIDSPFYQSVKEYFTIEYISKDTNDKNN